MRSVLQDLSFAFRQLLRHRVYAATAILSLALGIGATTAVYSVLYGVLLDPFPYRDSAHIADIVTQTKSGDKQNAQFSLAEMDLLRHAHAVTDVTGYRLTGKLLTGGEIPQSIHVAETTGNLFQFLDAPALLGRYYTTADAPSGAAPQRVAVVSYRFWKGHLGGSSTTVGSTVEIDHQPSTVIGIMGQRFTWLDADVYLPLPMSVEANTWLPTVIRVRPDLPQAEVVGELSNLLHQMAARHPSDHPGFTVTVETLNDNLLGEFKGTLLTLFVAVFLLLLISCGNVSILLLARGAARQYEFAMRSALGATRLRMVRQLLTEALCLSIAGGVLGVGVAFAAVRVIVRLLPEYAIPHEVVIQLNVPVLLFCIAVAVATGIVAGLSPALQLSSTGVAERLQGAGSRTVSFRGAKAQSAMILAQIALTVLLLAASGAGIQRYVEATQAKLGFNPKDLLLVFLSFPEHGHEGWRAGVNYEDALMEKVAAVPGVQGVTCSVTGFPPEGNWIQQVDIVGSATNGQHRAVVALVSADYFRVMDIPVVEGRSITRSEVLAGAHVAVVSSLFAHRFLDGADALGRQVTARELQHMAASGVVVGPKPDSVQSVPPNAQQPYQVVGVAADVRNDGLHQPIMPAVYLPSSAMTHGQGAFFARTAGDPLSLVQPIGRAIGSVDTSQAMDMAYGFEQFLGEFVWSRERFISSLFSLFAMVALALAAIGLISTVAFQVERRTHEIGIRYALGATRPSILLTALKPTMLTTVAGLALGMVLSATLNQFAFQWIHESIRGVPLLAGVAALLLGVAMLAALLTARRALRVDPMEALRAE